MSFTEMAASADSIIDVIKRDLPIIYVMEHFGHEMQPEGGEWRCVSPFREDSNPSFAVFSTSEDGTLDRWKDMSGGDSGDVLDLVQAFVGGSTSNAIAKARELLERPDLADWAGPTVGQAQVTFDKEAARAWYESTFDNGAQGLGAYLQTRSDHLADADPARLAEIFRIGWADGEIIVPYFTHADEFFTLKHRRPGEVMLALSGSRFKDHGILYGDWLDTDPSRTVVLCEGETDVWSGTLALPSDEYTVLGLPTGAGTNPGKAAARLAGRRVLLAFDADPAGRDATIKWATELIKNDCSVGICTLPAGRDLSRVADIPGIVRKARLYVPPMDDVLEYMGVYARKSRTDKGEHRPISDFTLEVLSSIQDQKGAVSFNVRLGLHEEQLHALDLLTAKQFRSWATKRGRAWTGNDSDTTALASLMRAASLFLPVDEAVDTAGYFEGNFVWPGGSVGGRPLLYVRPADRAVVDLDLHIEPGSPSPHGVNLLRTLHNKAVMDPILAWCAVAPLRSLFKSFPILNVSGPSGSGKTTLLDATLRAFSGSAIQSTLTSTTRFALIAFMQSTNAFPVWFDEYRPGARNATLQELQQLLRDSYDSQTSYKGGAGDTWNQVESYQTVAPIVVSGEDSFSETSHMERMIVVQLPLQGRNPGALAEVNAGTATSGLAHDYLRWLLADMHRNDYDGSLITPTPAGPEHLNPRQRANLGILQLGWAMLDDYISDQGGYRLGDPDWSGIMAEAEAALVTDPTREALLWAAERDKFGDGPVWIHAGDEVLYVQVDDFVQIVRKDSDFQLPGKAAAIRRLLETKYGAEPVRVSRGAGNRVRAHAVTLDALGYEA